MGASFPTFSLVINCMFNILDHSNFCIPLSLGTFLIKKCTLESFVTPKSSVEVHVQDRGVILKRRLQSPRKKSPPPFRITQASLMSIFFLTT